MPSLNHSLSLEFFLSLSLSLSISFSLSLSFSPSVYHSVYLSLILPFFLSLYLPVCLSLSLSMYLSVCNSLPLSFIPLLSLYIPLYAHHSNSRSSSIHMHNSFVQFFIRTYPLISTRSKKSISSGSVFRKSDIVSIFIKTVNTVKNCENWEWE